MRAVSVARHPARNGLQLKETQSQDSEQEHHLPVAEAGAGLGAANPAVQTEIVEGRKFPDLLAVRGKLTELARSDSDEHIQGQQQPGASAQNFGQRQQRSAHSPRKASGDGAKNNRGLKREVGG